MEVVWSRRIGVLLTLIGVLAACTDGGAPPEPAPSPSPTSSATPESAEAEGLGVAVVLPPESLWSETRVERIREELASLRRTHLSDVPTWRTVQPETPVFSRDLAAVLAEQGADLVCVIGPGAGAVVLEVAPAFPRTRFCATPAIAEPARIPANVLLIDVRVEEVGYVAGVAARLTSTTGPAGFVAAQDEYATDRRRGGFLAGLNADGPVPRSPYLAAPIGDADRAFELAAPRYAAGVQTIYTAAGDGDAGVRRAAQQHGGLVIGALDTLVPEPDEPLPVAVLLGTVTSLDGAVAIAVDQALSTWDGGLASVGLAEGALRLVPGGSARYAAIAGRLDDVRERIEGGELQPLAGS